MKKFKFSTWYILSMQNERTDFTMLLFNKCISNIFFIISFICLGVITVSLIPEQQTNAQINQAHSQQPLKTFVTYDNSSFGIRFEIPSDWKKITLITDKLAVISFLHSENFSERTPNPSISISIEKLENITSLGQYITIADRLLNTTLNGFHIVQSQPTTLAGLPANQRAFTIIQASTGLNIDSYQVITLNNNKAYIITYTSEATKYSNYLPIFQKLVSSFQITK